MNGKLTSHPLAAILIPLLPHVIAGIGVLYSKAYEYAALMRFFCAKKHPSCYDGMSKAAARLAGPSTSTPTLFIPSPMIGVFGDRFTTYIEGIPL